MVQNSMPRTRLRWSFGLGFIGGAVLLAISCFELVFRFRQAFWWTGGLYVYGQALVFTSITGVACGIVGAYGASIGKKMGGGLMITAGVITLICTSELFIFSGIFLLAGGLIAMRERFPLMSAIEEQI